MKILTAELEPTKVPHGPRNGSHPTPVSIRLRRISVIRPRRVRQKVRWTPSRNATRSTPSLHEKLTDARRYAPRRPRRSSSAKRAATRRTPPRDSLDGLGIESALQEAQMVELQGGQKFRVFAGATFSAIPAPCHTDRTHNQLDLDSCHGCRIIFDETRGASSSSPRPAFPHSVAPNRRHRLRTIIFVLFY